MERKKIYPHIAKYHNTQNICNTNNIQHETLQNHTCHHQKQTQHQQTTSLEKRTQNLLQVPPHFSQKNQIVSPWLLQIKKFTQIKLNPPSRKNPSPHIAGQTWWLEPKQTQRRWRRLLDKVSLSLCLEQLNKIGMINTERIKTDNFKAIYNNKD